MFSDSPQPLNSACAPGAEPLMTWANVVTALRTIVCAALFAKAAQHHSNFLNGVGLCIYWGLDMLDGYLARRLKQETRQGAQFDILSDRLLVALFYMNHLAWHLDLAVPIVLFLTQFMLIDHYLSNQFLRWNILSPNYFYRVDVTIWRLNWSPLAKLCNTGLVTLLILCTGSPRLPALVGGAIICIKLYSLLRLRRLTPPESSWGPPPREEPARAVHAAPRTVHVQYAAFDQRS